MRALGLAASLLLALALSGFAQKNWAGKAEYDLYARISAEPDPLQQITLLREWKIQYPQTEFKRERLLTLAIAHKKAGNVSESFIAANDVVRIEPDDTSALFLIVSLGPALPNPSLGDIAAVEAAANTLLAPRPRPVGRAVIPDPPAPSIHSEDPESQRVDSLVRTMRRNAKPSPDPAAALRRAAEAALEWVSKRKG